jgi:hypothetical protein
VKIALCSVSANTSKIALIASTKTQELESPMAERNKVPKVSMAALACGIWARVANTDTEFALICSECWFPASA